MSRPAASLEEHLTVAEVCGRLRVSRATVARALAQGRASGGRAGIYPARRIGRALRIPATAVNRWLMAGGSAGE
jgi:excisionase family DNA binding protein